MEGLWPLLSRVEAWNLFLDAAKTMKYSLSPVVTSSFLYLYQILLKNQMKLEKSGCDLITLCLTSFLINVKAEGIDANLETIIKAFAKLSVNLSPEQQEILGQGSVSNLMAIHGGVNPVHLKRITSLILQLEPEMLALNGWEFITDHPFSPLMDWISILRKHTTEEQIEQHRKMRKEAVRNLCALIIASEGPHPPGRIIAGAALTYALYNFPAIHGDITHENWFQKLNYLGFSHAQEPEIQEIINISHLIPTILDKIIHVFNIE